MTGTAIAQQNECKKLCGALHECDFSNAVFDVFSLTMPPTPVAHKANVAERTAARRDPDATRARLLKGGLCAL